MDVLSPRIRCLSSLSLSGNYGGNKEKPPGMTNKAASHNSEDAIVKKQRFPFA